MLNELTAGYAFAFTLLQPATDWCVKPLTSGQIYLPLDIIADDAFAMWPIALKLLWKVGQLIVQPLSTCFHLCAVYLNVCLLRWFIIFLHLGKHKCYLVHCCALSVSCLSAQGLWTMSELNLLPHYKANCLHLLKRMLWSYLINHKNKPHASYKVTSCTPRPCQSPDRRWHRMFVRCTNVHPKQSDVEHCAELVHTSGTVM